MGNYATTTSFTDLLVNFLKGNTAASDTAGVAMIDKHIARAEAYVDSYLSQNYAIPFNPIPPEVRRITEDIASYYLIRGANYQDGKNKNQYLEEFKTAFKDLEQIITGSRKLVNTDGSLVPVASAIIIQSSSEHYTPIFGHDNPKNWEISANESNDQADARDGS